MKYALGGLGLWAGGLAIFGWWLYRQDFDTR